MGKEYLKKVSREIPLEFYVLRAALPKLHDCRRDYTTVEMIIFPSLHCNLRRGRTIHGQGRKTSYLLQKSHVSFSNRKCSHISNLATPLNVQLICYLLWFLVMKLRKLRLLRNRGKEGEAGKKRTFFKMQNIAVLRSVPY